MILFVFEGERIEKQIFDSIVKYFFSSSLNQPVIRASFKAELFQLWNTVKDDADLDIVEILKERPDSEIKDIGRNDISEIHLFFDHDAHSHADKISQREYHEKICNLLDTFCDEFERGKLWINYPMAEAIKHCRKTPADCFRDASLDIADNDRYKEVVDAESDFRHINNYDLSVWHYLTAINIQRTFCLVNNEYEPVSDYNRIKPWFDQHMIITRQIQESQYEKFICPKNEVAALSSFPLFLVSYYGEKFFSECACSGILKNCSFFCYQG